MDFGVFVDEEPKFHAHVSKIVENASRLLGLIRANFRCLDTVTIRRSVAKLIPELKHLPYDHFKRLRALGLSILHHLRRRGDMMQTHKIINGIDRVDSNIFFELSSGSVTRGHNQKLVKTC